VSTPELAAAAAALTRLGWLVFPCRADKTPACPHGCKDSSADPAAVRRMFLHARDAVSIGLATGPLSGIAAVDIDPQGLPWMRARLARNSLPQTRIHRTPRGGYHLLYRYPAAGLHNSASKLSWGVDMRGLGGYIIVPPSAGYAIVDECEPTAFPRWILAALKRIDAAAEARIEREARGNGPLKIEALARFVGNSRQGERNNCLFWAAARAGENGLGTDELVAAAEAIGLPKKEAVTTAWSGARRGRRDGPRR
jgi:Bifunctional DNA primase/polymerase, N-terminal